MDKDQSTMSVAGLILQNCPVRFGLRLGLE
jgi:hypothetical protein